MTVAAVFLDTGKSKGAAAGEFYVEMSEERMMTLRGNDGGHVWEREDFAPVGKEAMTSEF
jgi:hypothetical protein